ncbi:MAG TPA: YidC/Oxa1 family insertase periplasmic-domain containing protein [Planctomycetaceae bacterium]|nr:YidC/Oxa1 family insertase periplasmic-domain containing protein [Planctomycetaceae bacterium]
MDQKRFLLFIVLAMGILIGWNVLMMRFRPPQKPNIAAQNQQQDQKADKPGEKKAKRDEAAGEPQVAEDAADDETEEPGEEKPKLKPGEEPEVAANAEADEAPPEKKKPAAIEVPKFPETTVDLGSADFQTGYRQLVTLWSRGASVKQIELNDPRYLTLTKPHVPLVIVGENGVFPTTLDMSVPQLKPDLTRLNWELVEVYPKNPPHSVAVFRLVIDNVELVKRYELSMIDKALAHPEAPAYSLFVDLSFRNLGRRAQTIEYVLEGPTGLPLENVENTQKYRDIVVGFQPKPGTINHELMSAKTIAEGNVEQWKQPVKYIGTDAQFFASLIVPVDDQLDTPYIQSATQELIGPNLKEKSEVAVKLTSVELALGKAGSDSDAIDHSYRLFAGPKRDDVLPEGAAKVIDFGWFHFISRPMLFLLKFFHAIFGNWGIAIICLTVVVRSAMFPVSIRQARSAAKMQLMQPEIAALKEKYGKDKEKFARAQMELYSKHKFNPLAGCLPLFIQLPIFMGLYQALNHAVDLRLASFLWIDNLAAPDALFQMPFAIPFLGHEFNLLPIITTALFYVQQKMFMPPPATEELAMQQKVMNYMMLAMGVMFYKVPAGLCVYFIASSLWGMGERKFLTKVRAGAKTEPPPPGPLTGRRRPPGPDDDDRDNGGRGSGGGGLFGGGGLLSKLLKAAEKESSARRSSRQRRK